MTEETNGAITINTQQAAVLYTALEAAVEVAERAAALKASKAAKGAFGIQIASYRAEMDRLSAAFPRLVPADSAASQPA